LEGSLKLRQEGVLPPQKEAFSSIQASP
jgi:hypothetical protein